MERRKMKNFALRTGDYIVSCDEGGRCVKISHFGDEKGKALYWDPSHKSGIVPDISGEHEIWLECENELKKILILCENNIGKYSFGIQIDESHPGLVKTWSDVELKADIEPEGFDLTEEGEYFYLDENGKNICPDIFDYLNKPTGFPVVRPSWRTDLNQLVYFGDKDVLGSAVLYYGDFTDMDSYFCKSGTAIFYDIESDTHDDIVKRIAGYGNKGSDGSFGVKVQKNVSTLNKGDKLRFSSSVIYITGILPDINDDEETALTFIKGYENIFYAIKKPERIYYNWDTAARNVIQELYDRKGGEKGIYHYGGDLNFQLDSFLEYFKIFMPERVEAQQKESEARIWAQNYPEYVNDKGSQGLFGWYKDRKGAAYADCWQAYTWPLVMATEYSIKYDNKEMQKAMLKNADVLIDTARGLDYSFSVMVDINKGERVDSAYDMDYGNAGSYVYGMVLYYELTKDEKFLKEAETAADKLASFGFAASGFELNVTAQSVYGLLKLYKITKKEKYIYHAYIQLACILKHTWLFNPQYGKFKDRYIFMLSSARANLDYSNPAEEGVIIRYFYRCLREFEDILDPSVANLMGEVISWKQVGCGDAIPAFHRHKDVIHTGVPMNWDEIYKDGYIGMEPSGYICDKVKLGSINECVYGIGMNLELAMSQMIVMGNDIMYTETPLAVNKEEDFWKIRILGLQRTAVIGLKGDMKIQSDNGLPDYVGEYYPDGWKLYKIHPGKEYKIYN